MAHRRTLVPSTLGLILLGAVLSGAVPDTTAPAVDPALFQGLKFRGIGPARGGRVTAVAGHRRQPGTFYMGATGGGVWKTVNYGQTWLPISDGAFETGSIGAIAVAESNPDVVLVGTGSAAIRSNVILGKGVYKSTDGGRTWRHVGLRDAGQIGSVRIDPRNPDVVWVAALGSPFGPGPARGVFKTTDGGATWRKVLFVNDRIGAVSLSLNPSNPDEIFAGMWQAQRKPWTIVSGGPASKTGLYKSTDAGDTWRKIDDGLPADLIGKIAVSVSPADPRRVYVLLEAPAPRGGLYVSDDGGERFRQVSGDPRLVSRPFYYIYVDAHPKERDTVYVNGNVSFFGKSTDGGRTWTVIPTPHADNHGMWINPDTPEIFIQSNDGGANVTLDGGASWSTQYNQPTAELYQVEVDDQVPYRVYGAQQDNSTLIVPSLPPLADGVDDPMQWWMRGAGCETGPVKPHPTDPAIVYGVCKGEFSRLSLRTGQEQHFWVYPQNRYGHAARDIRYRFQRTSPFEISPHDPRVIYHGSHVLHRTRDEGRAWEVISPDLTANEPGKQGVSGEPITRDITGEEVYSTIYAIEESPIERGVIWVGANDGPVHVTRDGGANWTNVTPKGLPPGGRVQQIDPSPHRKGSAYIAVYRYLLDDFAPYIYRTDDYGATWTRLTDGRNGIPADYPTRVVREDPDRAGLLYAGTEFGLFVSFDDGGRWQPLQLNLPRTPVTDLRLHRRDLVVSTMGRGFWILDNVTPLHALAGSKGEPSASHRETGAGATTASQDHAGVRLIAPGPALRLRYSAARRRPADPEFIQPGAIIDYVLAQPARTIRLDVLDAEGSIVRTYSAGREPGRESDEQAGAMRGPRGRVAATPLGITVGHHRFIWDLRASVEGVPAPGPHVPPGRYTVRITAGEAHAEAFVDVEMDPRVVADGVTARDVTGQYAFNLAVLRAVGEARALGRSVEAARDAARAAGEADSERTAALDALHATLVTAEGPYPQPMLADQFANIYRMTSQADQPVPADARLRFEDLAKALEAARREAARWMAAPQAVP